MKKIISAILCIMMLLAVVSCDSFKIPNLNLGGTSDSSSAPPSSSSSEGGNDALPEYDYEGYKEIEPNQVQAWQTAFFGYKSEARIVQLSLPQDWSFRQSGDVVSIYKGATTIGKVVRGEYINNKQGMKIISENDTQKEGIQCKEIIAAAPINKRKEECEFTRAYTYKYVEGTEMYVFTLQVNYDCLDEASAKKCTEEITMASAYGDAYKGKLMLDENAPKKILVLGNSFVGGGSSRIDEFLQTMFNGTEYETAAISYGMAEVSDTRWDEFVWEIKEGMWGIVFMCGFYGEDDTPALKRFIDACEESDTKLVIFPAHNEMAEHFALEAYPEIPVLYWKQEINNLMDKYGIDMWDFCYDDTHKHSKPLAGYVGAHMIYRAIMNEYPSSELSFYSLDKSEIERFLGDYVRDGAASIRTDNAYAFTPMQ